MKINLSEYFPDRIKEQEEQAEFEKKGGKYPKPPKGWLKKLLQNIRKEND